MGPAETGQVDERIGCAVGAHRPDTPSRAYSLPVQKPYLTEA